MRKVKGLLGIIVASFLLLHAGGTIAYADDHGNNGTLKVVSATDPGADMDNDPKVCSFHLAGFKFDKSSSGTWSITGQGGGAGAGTASGSWTANANGDWSTQNMTLPDGQYKASAKQMSPATSGGEKQKVFKVNCKTTTSPGTTTPANGNGQGSGGQQGSTQPASMTGTGSKTKGGTGSKSKAKGSATGTGSQSKNNSGGSNATNGGTAPSVNGTDNTASVSEHGEQGVSVTPPTTTTTTETSTGAQTAASANATSSTTTPGEQGFVHVPTTQTGVNSGANSNMGNQGQNATSQNAQGFSNLPSTSSNDANGPLTGLGALLIAFGAFLLRRPGRQMR